MRLSSNRSPQESHRSRRGSRGIALLELLTISSLLGVMFVATCDLGNALNQYLTLNRIAGEGAHYASEVSGLEVGSFHPGDLSPERQTLVFHRVRELLSRAGLESVTTDVQSSNINNQFVTVSLQAQYRSPFGIFKQLPLKVSVTGSLAHQTARKVS